MGGWLGQFGQSDARYKMSFIYFFFTQASSLFATIVPRNNAVEWTQKKMKCHQAAATKKL